MKKQEEEVKRKEAEQKKWLKAASEKREKEVAKRSIKARQKVNKLSRS